MGRSECTFRVRLQLLLFVVAVDLMLMMDGVSIGVVFFSLLGLLQYCYVESPFSVHHRFSNCSSPTPTTLKLWVMYIGGFSNQYDSTKA